MAAAVVKVPVPPSSARHSTLREMTDLSSMEPVFVVSRKATSCSSVLPGLRDVRMVEERDGRIDTRSTTAPSAGRRVCGARHTSAKR